MKNSVGILSWRAVVLAAVWVAVHAAAAKEESFHYAVPVKYGICKKSGCFGRSSIEHGDSGELIVPVEKGDCRLSYEKEKWTCKSGEKCADSKSVSIIKKGHFRALVHRGRNSSRHVAICAGSEVKMRVGFGKGVFSRSVTFKGAANEDKESPTLTIQRQEIQGPIYTPSDSLKKWLSDYDEDLDSAGELEEKTRMRVLKLEGSARMRVLKLEGSGVNMKNKLYGLEFDIKVPIHIVSAPEAYVAYFSDGNWRLDHVDESTVSKEDPRIAITLDETKKPKGGLMVRLEECQSSSDMPSNTVAFIAADAKQGAELKARLFMNRDQDILFHEEYTQTAPTVISTETLGFYKTTYILNDNIFWASP